MSVKGISQVDNIGENIIMIIKYKTDYFSCSLSTMKKFNEQLQKTIDHNTKDGWRLHSYQLLGVGSQFCSLVFYKEYSEDGLDND